ncbi:MAG: NAD(P)H-hydrate dehydratase [Clostridia bacterium]|nr:NAD(P)H-hydrate dehydratase [Clostridia bacterium]
MQEKMRFSYTLADLSLMPKRPRNSNKGSFGRVLCVCGSRGMAGAAFLCAKAALRSGAGLVEILTHEDNRIILQSLLPEAIVTCYDDNTLTSDLIEPTIKRADVVVVGCGLGVSREALLLLSKALRACSVPLVIDADALNLISQNPSLKKYAKGAIITPHPLEFSRISGLTPEQIATDREGACKEFAKSNSLVCLLKGHQTVVSDGEKIYLNTSGNSGMATAGSGDVLSGIIGGILAQNKSGELDAIEVASLAAYIHGLCGDISANSLGEYSVIASDLIASLPRVLKGIHRETQSHPLET